MSRLGRLATDAEPTRQRRMGQGPDRPQRVLVGEVYSEAMLKLSFAAFYQDDLEWASYYEDSRPQPGDEI